MTTGPQVEPTSRTVVVQREYADPIGDVWTALTESDRLARWLGHYTGTGGAGGTVELTMTGEVDAGGEVAAPVTVSILECDPPRRLVVDLPESADRVWRVTVTLAAEAGRTVLRLEQQVVDGLDAADVEAGWSWYLDRLGASLHGEPMPPWTDYLPGRRVGLDVEHHLTAVRRLVDAGGPVRVVTLSRGFAAPADDVWDACTDPERLARWFLPVAGDLRPGGRYRIEGMGVGGAVERCDPPRSFALTWESRGDVSRVVVRLEPASGGGTTLTLHHTGHTDDAFWARFGPGATGVGWELMLLGLAGHLGADGVPTPAEAQTWSTSEEGRAFATRSAGAWGVAHVASGADPRAAEAAAGRTGAFYTGTAAPDSPS